MSGRIISSAESWETAYTAFNNINFAAFDYNTIKSSMMDYIKLYFPETFNDYIESSEFIALLELFAYLGEILAYRIDVTSQENFIPTAQRKDSILRLAKLISYAASRNIPARALVKMTSVRTSEVVYDSRGVNLSNQKINWNDPTNPNWKEQFLIVINTILKQNFGSVSPSERTQVQDVLFELYSINSNPITNGVIPYSLTVSGQSIPMELVPVSLNADGPYEKRPEFNSSFSILYGADGLGDSSNTTGFFMFTKQGTLNRSDYTFDGITPNQTVDIGAANINETDLWVNNVDPSNGFQIVSTPFSQSTVRAGEWVPVDISSAQNIIFNTNVIRNKYEVETLNNDDVRLIFGDGEFANIPNGAFQVWYRTSINSDLVIPQSAITNMASSINYQDSAGNSQLFSFTFSATGAIQNSAISEDIEHIRKMAPAVYYTQDRMVNGRDYNTFMLQDSSILKLRSINRTFAGESNYISWNDPSGAYDNIKIFGDDMAMYIKTLEVLLPTVPASTATLPLVLNYIEPLLSNPELFTRRSLTSSADASRVKFTLSERNNIVSVLDQGSYPVYLYYDNTVSPPQWVAAKLADSSTCATESTDVLRKNCIDPGGWLVWIDNPSNNGWIVSYKSARIVAESPTTKFWFNTEGRVINYSTLNPGNDLIVLLKANPSKNYDTVRATNTNFIVLNQETIGSGLPNQGLPNINQLRVINEDINGDGIPDFPSGVPMSDIMSPQITKTVTELGALPALVTLPITYIVGMGDVVITSMQGSTQTSLVEGTDWDNNGVITNDINSTIKILQLPVGTTSVTITVNEYVYFYRPDISTDWSIVDNDTANMFHFAQDAANTNYKRELGRNGLNFLWLHKTVNYNLIDPAATNIIDTFIIPRGYYLAVRQWLSGLLPTEPAAPTPLELRTSYATLLDNKMISDTLILHSGKFKYLFGPNAVPELQATFMVVRSANTTSTDNQIKLKIIDAVNAFFDINQWEFGETFYFTELAAVIHAKLPTEIDTVVLVPTSAQNLFGDMFQVNAGEGELFLPNLTVDNITMVSSLNRLNIRQSS